MKKLRLITNIVGAVLILAYLIALLALWEGLPNSIPTHFNAAGVPDRFGGKTSLLMEPILSVVLFAVFAAVERFPNSWNLPVKITEENRERQYYIAAWTISILKVLTIGIILMGGLAGILIGFPMWVIIGFLFLLAGVAAAGIAVSIRNR